jgi:hypothetical protein
MSRVSITEMESPHFNHCIATRDLQNAALFRGNADIRRFG